eukprot:TRINITY_DN1445_c0_g2_i1.p1 TRINITY_DN1445_c0_g2~~TRINITY_DN1445_c0_g2_i1.p1  ORF type:complete len:437 (-),score=170.25 TRINITY_DN1445_c0_g2_i1:58-1308(-)
MADQLFRAAGKGQANKVIQLLESNPALLQHNDKRGQNILMYACEEGQDEVVEELLTRFSDELNVNQKDKAGHSALLIACMADFDSIACLLLEHKAECAVSSDDGYFCVHHAVRGSMVSVVESILEKYPQELNRVTTKEKMSALHLAVLSGNDDMVSLLVEAGINKELADFEGNTALHYAAREGNVQMCDYLGENQANVNAQNKDGDTPLHLAAVNYPRRAGGLERALVKHGANKNATNKAGLTPAAAADQAIKQHDQEEEVKKAEKQEAASLRHRQQEQACDPDLHAWLEGHGLVSLAAVFGKKGLSLDDLKRHFTDDTALKKLGINPERKKLLAALQQELEQNPLPDDEDEEDEDEDEEEEEKPRGKKSRRQRNAEDDPALVMDDQEAAKARKIIFSILLAFFFALYYVLKSHEK